MRLYVINMNPQPNTRDNEVHVRGCTTLNFANNLRDLGFHNSCHTAVAQAKQMGFTNADGCYYCCRPCHTS